MLKWSPGDLSSPPLPSPLETIRAVCTWWKFLIWTQREEGECIHYPANWIQMVESSWASIKMFLLISCLWGFSSWNADKKKSICTEAEVERHCNSTRNAVRKQSTLKNLLKGPSHLQLWHFKRLSQNLDGVTVQSKLQLLSVYSNHTQKRDTPASIRAVWSLSISKSDRQWRGRIHYRPSDTINA